MYGSQVAAEPPFVVSPPTSSGLPTLGLDEVEAQACVAAFEAAGRVRNVLAILAEEIALPPDRNVRNIPLFFSGLGVLDPLRLVSIG